MKRWLCALLGALAATTLVRGGSGIALGDLDMMFSGTIIDNACASAHKAGLDEFIKTHAKECAIAQAYMGSGYSIYSLGKVGGNLRGILYEFDSASSAKIGEFLKNRESSLEVTVTVQKVGGKLSLVSIENRK